MITKGLPILILVQVAIATLFETDKLFFQRDLANVYDCDNCDKKPPFTMLPWCLLDGNSEIMYVQCDGVDYTMLFDAKSFILDKQFPKRGSD